jgi:hypothetical protein
MQAAGRRLKIAISSGPTTPLVLELVSLQRDSASAILPAFIFSAPASKSQCLGGLRESVHHRCLPSTWKQSAPLSLPISATANHDFDQCKATLRKSRVAMSNSGNIALLNCFPVKNDAVYFPVAILFLCDNKPACPSSICEIQVRECCRHDEHTPNFILEKSRFITPRKTIISTTFFCTRCHTEP